MRCRFPVILFITRLLTLAALVGPMPLAMKASYNWKPVKIGGGGFVPGIIFHPTQPGLAYCRTDVGGAYRWDKATDSWIPLNDNLNHADGDLAGIAGLALDPRDPDKVYLAAGLYLQTWGRTGAIMRSSDCGATWSRTELPIRLGGNADGRSGDERLIVDPNLSSTLYLASDVDGLWRSTDSGVTWAKLASFPASGANLIIADAGSGTAGSATPRLYAAGYSVSFTTDSWGNRTSFTFSEPKLYASTDAGTSWTVVSGTPSGYFPSHAVINASGILYATFTNNLGPAGATSGSVRYYTPATAKWTDITPAEAQGYWGISGLALDENAPGTIVISTLDRYWPTHDEIFRSTDNGVTWKGILVGAPRDYSSAPYATGSSLNWVSDVEIDPTDSNRILFTTGGGLFMTTNAKAADTGAGTSVAWRYYNEGIEETAALSLATPASGAPLVSAIGDVAGFRHDSLDRSPANQHRVGTATLGTCTSIDVAALAPSRLVLTGWLNNTLSAYLSTDGGATWTTFASKPTLPNNNPGIIAINADGTRILWAPANSVPQVSTNGGSSWAPASGISAISDRTLQPVTDKVNPLRAYIYHPSSGQLYASTDGGSNWSAVSTTTLPTWAGTLRSVHRREGHLWLAAPTSGLYRSTNGGATWTQLAGITRVWHLSEGKPASDADYPTLFIHGICNGTEGLFRSTDEGLNWSRINDDRHMFGNIADIAGDQQVHGRLYVAAGGRGILYGEAGNLPNLPAYDWATFTANTPGTYTPNVTAAADITYSATGLPAWAHLDTATGAITGTADTGAGTIVAVQLTATQTNTGATTSGQVNILVAAPGNDLRIFALSARAQVLTGNNCLIPGIVVGGTAQQTYMVRAIGPGLPTEQIPNYLADPQMQLVAMRATGNVTLTENDNWGEGNDPATMRTTFATLGMGALRDGSKDSAIIATIPQGNYSAVITGKNGTTGVAIMEIYDAGGTANPGQLRAISCRAVVGTGANVLIPGLAMVGGGKKRLIVRVAGPQLANSGLQNELLNDPQITVYSGSTPIAYNDDWQAGNDVAAITEATKVIGTSFADGSKDSAIIVSLVTGNYTFVVSGKNGATGVAVVEMYLLD